jgi:hypothetical protein
VDFSASESRAADHFENVLRSEIVEMPAVKTLRISGRPRSSTSDREPIDMDQVADVRRLENHQPSRHEYSLYFPQERPRIKEVLDHIEARNPIEGPIPERKVGTFECGPNDLDPGTSCDFEGRSSDVGSDSRGRRRHAPQERAAATADVKDARPRRNVGKGI